MPMLDKIMMITLGTFRIGGVLVSMPVFGASPFPPLIKYFLAFAISFAIFPFQHPVSPVIWSSEPVLLLAVTREIGLGLIMGYSARLLFLLMSLSLEFVGLQIGFSIATFFDPQNNAEVSVVAQIGVVISVLIFIGTNMDHDLFRAVVRSYDIMPIGVPDWNMGDIMHRLLQFVSITFEMALRLAVPVMVGMLVMHVVLGVVSRTAPQMNLFFNVSFIVSLVSGLLLLVLILPQMLSRFLNMGRMVAAHGYGLW